MDSEWLKEDREKRLARALAAPGLTLDQLAIVRRMDQEWSRRGLTLASRWGYAVRAVNLGRSLQKRFEKASRKDLEWHLESLAKRVKPATVEREKRFLKTFYRALLAPEATGHPPIVSWIRGARTERSCRTPDMMLTPTEVLSLAAATASPRDRALILVLYESAARAGEIVNATIGDVRFDDLGARLTLRGKTGERWVRLVRSAADLQAWVDDYHPLKSQKDAPLFVSLGHQNFWKPLLIDGIQNVVRNAARASQIGKRVFPHLFRHSRITELSKKLTPSELEIFAGWTPGSQMTRVYVHLNSLDVEQKMLENEGLVKKSGETLADPLAAKTCLRCRKISSAAARHCQTCKLPLDEQEVLRMAELQDKLIRNLPKLLALVNEPWLPTAKRPNDKGESAN